MTSTNLVRWGYKVLLIDDRPTPTPAGRADGLHPRSIQVLTDMGFHDALWQHKPEASTTLNFWIGMCDGLQRITRMPACPPSVDTRTPYVLGLHQGLIESLFLDDMEKRGVVCQRPWTFRAYELDEDKDEISQYPVTVHIQHVNDSTKRSVRAKYLFSGEGARSITRRQAGIETEWKDSKVSHYGVMDGEVDSDFPDIRVSLTKMSKIQDSCCLTLLVGSMRHSELERLHHAHPPGEAQAGPGLRAA